MSQDYWERVKETLFQNSIEQKDTHKAMLEWRWNGEWYDAKEGNATQRAVDEGQYPACQLCDHPEIRFSFTIINLENENKLLIGKECIKRFIPIDADDKTITSIKEKGKILDKAIRKRQQDTKVNAVIANIVEISRKDTDFDITRLLEQFDKKHGFTVKQLKMLLGIYHKLKITYNINNYKLRLRRKKDKSQIFMLLKWQFESLRPIIPTKFQQEYLKMTKK